MNIMKALAWFEIVGCLGVGIALIVIPLVTSDILPSAGIYVRGMAVIVFGLFWGLRTLRQESMRERYAKLGLPIPKIGEKENVSQAQLEKEHKTLERERVEFANKRQGKADAEKEQK